MSRVILTAVICAALFLPGGIYIGTLLIGPPHACVLALEASDQALDLMSQTVSSNSRVLDAVGRWLRTGDSKEANQVEVEITAQDDITARMQPVIVAYQARSEECRKS